MSAQTVTFAGYTVGYGQETYEQLVPICSRYGKNIVVIGGEKALAAAKPYITAVSYTHLRDVCALMVRKSTIDFCKTDFDKSRYSKAVLLLYNGEEADCKFLAQKWNIDVESFNISCNESARNSFFDNADKKAIFIGDVYKRQPYHIGRAACNVHIRQSYIHNVA